MVKRLSLGLLSLLLIVVLAACGGAAKESASSGSDNTTTKNESVKLQIVGSDWDDTSMEKLKTENPSSLYYQVRNAVEERYPDYKVDFQNWGWAEELDQKQRAAILSGNVPDIVHGETFMPTYAAEDILAPLPEDIVNAVNPNFLIRNKAGEPVGVSPKGNVFLLFYNKDLLTQAGMDAESVQLDSWDAWKTVADKITAEGAGDLFGGAIPSHPNTGGALRFTAVARSVGADWGGGDEVTINTPEMAKALQYLRDMDQNFPKGIGNGTDEGPLYKMFNEDKNLGFVINGTWQTGDAKTHNLNYGVTSLPVAEGGESSNCLVGFDYYGVTKASKNQEAAFNVIRLMLDKDILKTAVQKEVVPPATTELQADGEILGISPILEMAIQEISKGELKGLPVFNKNNSQIWDIINTKVIARATMTSDSIDEILKEAQSETERLLQ